jgi:hypothetical protein
MIAVSCGPRLRRRPLITLAALSVCSEANAEENKIQHAVFWSEQHVADRICAPEDALKVLHSLYLKNCAGGHRRPEQQRRAKK